MIKNDITFLIHIQENIEKIEKSLSKINKNDFMINEDKQDANIRRIEVIGEATKNLSLELINRNKFVEWKKIAKTRDKLIHGYFGVDLDLVWDILQKDIPELKENINKKILDLEKEN